MRISILGHMSTVGSAPLSVRRRTHEHAHWYPTGMHVCSGSALDANFSYTPFFLWGVMSIFAATPASPAGNLT